MNQKIAELDKAYAAGFFDGEGTVWMSAPEKPSKTHYVKNVYTLIVDLGQRDAGPLHWLIERWGGNSYTRKIDGLNMWRLHGSTAAQFLRDILPYSKVKRKVILLGLRFQSTKSKGFHGPEHLAWCKSIRQQIQYLNRSHWREGYTPGCYDEPQIENNKHDTPSLYDCQLSLALSFEEHEH